MKHLKEETFMHNINLGLLFLIGTSCLIYSLYNINRYFAEINVQLPFLDFPIFIGEILLGICLILSIMKWMIVPFHEIKKWHIVFIAYIIFILNKAVMGYFEYGPLAFRDAAMFYYPLFAVISYNVFRKDIFAPSVSLFLFLLIIFTIKYIYLAFYLYFYLIVGLILALTFKDKMMRYLSVGSLLVIIPFEDLFCGARTLLVASTFSFIALSGMFLIILNIKKVYKFLLLFVSIIIIMIISSSLGSRSSVMSLISLTSPRKLIQFVKKFDAVVEANKRTYKPIKILPKLYNPNDPIPFEEVKKTSFRLPIVLNKKPAHEIITKLHQITPQKLPSKLPQVEAPEGISPIITIPQTEAPEEISSGLDLKYGTVLFRIYVFRDVIDQFLIEKPILGFAFGRPFRSRRCEIIGSTYGEWSRDGWITMHNSYLNIVYRAGLIGIILLILLLINVSRMSMAFIRAKSKMGVSLVSIIFFWLVTCFFSVTFEMPYYAIPFWSLYGFILAFSHNLKTIQKN